MDAIEPDEGEGEPPLLPVLNRHKPIGTTAGVDFKTVRPCVMTNKSHVNQVVADTNSWEQQAVVQMEMCDAVKFYVRNEDQDSLVLIPYEYFDISKHYKPDFMVRLINDMTVLLEIKGFEDNEDKAKHEAAKQWVRAVNNWGKLGQWVFHVCRDPMLLGRELTGLSRKDGSPVV
jgi:type III restriction enzyme